MAFENVLLLCVIDSFTYIHLQWNPFTEEEESFSFLPSIHHAVNMCCLPPPTPPPPPPTRLPSPGRVAVEYWTIMIYFWCLPTGKVCWSLKMCTPTTQPSETPTCWRRRWRKMLRNWMPSDKNYINLRWLRTCVPVPVLLHVRLQLHGSGGTGVFVVAVVHLGACAVRNSPRCPCCWCVVFDREAVFESSLLVMSVHLFLRRETAWNFPAGNVCLSVLEVEAVWNFHLVMSVCF